MTYAVQGWHQSTDTNLSIGDIGRLRAMDDALLTSGHWPTFLVAASNAPAAVRAHADYVCDGTADDVEIQAALDALPAEGGCVQLSTGLFDIAAKLIIDSSTTTLRGSGMAGDEVTATSLRGTSIRWKGAFGGTMVEIQSPSAASELLASGIENLTVVGANGSFTPAIGLYMRWVRRGILHNVEIRNCSTANLDMYDCSHTEYSTGLIRAVDGNGNTGIGIRFGGANVNGDCYHCFFTNVFVEHKNGVGIQLNATDTNRFIGCTAHRALGGTAVGIEFNGSNVSDAGTARYNTLIDCDLDYATDGTRSIVARGTSSFTFPSHNNRLLNYTKGNAEPAPTIETGATLFVDRNDGTADLTSITFGKGTGAGPIFTSNAGSPESVVTAPLGSYCADSTNGEGYIKKTGSGNTGWKLVTHA